jgi:uncharacterized protein involved in exopolysaccharide biosynthesis
LTYTAHFEFRWNFGTREYRGVPEGVLDHVTVPTNDPEEAIRAYRELSPWKRGGDYAIVSVSFTEDDPNRPANWIEAVHHDQAKAKAQMADREWEQRIEPLLKRIEALEARISELEDQGQ